MGRGFRLRTGIARAATTLALIAGGLVGAVSATAPAGAVVADGYRPLTPARLLDTRSGSGAPAGRVGPGATLTFQVTGRGGVPATGVDAVSVTITATAPSSGGWVTAWPAGATRPNASNLNFVGGQTVANFAIVKLSGSGQMSLYNATGSTHLLVDVAGWFPTGSDYTSLTPSRIVNTRSGVGAPAQKVGPGQTLTVQVAGQGGIPASGVDAVAVNLTATQPTATGWATAWPAGSTRPTASNLNFVAAQTVPNFAVVKLSASGQMSIYNNTGDTHFLVDVAGWFPTGSNYTPLSPSRILDTRNGTGAPAAAKIGPGQTLDLQVTGVGGVPNVGVNAVAVNITATQPTASGWITAWPAGQTRPNASNVNFAAAKTVPNFAIVKLSPSGGISLYNSSGTTHLLVDVAGWFAKTNLLDVQTVSRGYGHSCATIASGQVDCWGFNTFGQLGNGNTTWATSPVVVTGLNNATSVSAGPTHTCAITTAGQVKCWGQNNHGQLGNGTTADSSTPVTTGGVSAVNQITAGGYFSCALLGDQTVKCWGDNSLGQLGNGTTTSSSLPVAVSGLTGVAEVAAGATHVCARLSSGQVKCWGDNANGQLGNGTTTMSKVPVSVTGITTATSIGAGGSTCARVQLGGVWCWGSNSKGQLGNNSTTSSSTPVAVTGMTDASWVTVGANHACALKSDATAACWGNNTNGELGTGTNAQSHVPVAVMGLSMITSISAAGSGTCATLTSQQARCWGYNYFGQNGDGTNTDRNAPVVVLTD